MCPSPPSPQKRTIQNSPKQMAIVPIEFFLSDNYQSIIKNICAKFHKKPNSSQKIDLQKRPKKYENCFLCNKY